MNARSVSAERNRAKAGLAVEQVMPRLVMCMVLYLIVCMELSAQEAISRLTVHIPNSRACSKVMVVHGNAVIVRLMRTETASNVEKELVYYRTMSSGERELMQSMIQASNIHQAAKGLRQAAQLGDVIVTIAAHTKNGQVFVCRRTLTHLESGAGKGLPALYSYIDDFSRLRATDTISYTGVQRQQPIADLTPAKLQAK